MSDVANCFAFQPYITARNLATRRSRRRCNDGQWPDTVFLAEHIGKTGHVYSFDIQQQAIDATREKLEQHQLEERVSLFLQGHETLGEVIAEQQDLKAGIFNLGYLPKVIKQSSLCQRLHAQLWKKY